MTGVNQGFEDLAEEALAAALLAFHQQKDIRTIRFQRIDEECQDTAEGDIIDAQQFL
jgi:hypothetical protein